MPPKNFSESGIEVRCANPVEKIYGDKKKVTACNALLAKVNSGRGGVRCWKCNHLTEWDVSGQALAVG